MRIILIRNIRQNRSIYEQLLKDGIDSEAGTTLLNIIRDDLIAQGLEPTDARQFALSGLRTYLQIEYQKSHFNEKTGWYVNWKKLAEKGEKIYALVIKGTTDVQGLIATHNDESNIAVYITWAVAAPQNNPLIALHSNLYRTIHLILCLLL